MKQRVSLCRALIADPAILLMDEPFSALDAITRDDMNIVLLALWERYRKTVLFVTHSIREAVLLSDRVLVMGGRPSTSRRTSRCRLGARGISPSAKPLNSTSYAPPCATRLRKRARAKPCRMAIMAEDGPTSYSLAPGRVALTPSAFRLQLSRQVPVFVLPIVTAFMFLLSWQAISVFGRISPAILPPPTMVLGQLWRIFR